METQDFPGRRSRSRSSGSALRMSAIDGDARTVANTVVNRSPTPVDRHLVLAALAERLALLATSDEPVSEDEWGWLQLSDDFRDRLSVYCSEVQPLARQAEDIFHLAEALRPARARRRQHTSVVAPDSTGTTASGESAGSDRRVTFAAHAQLRVFKP
jgi:hypothetical protein